MSQSFILYFTRRAEAKFGRFKMLFKPPPPFDFCTKPLESPALEGCNPPVRAGYQRSRIW